MHIGRDINTSSTKQQVRKELEETRAAFHALLARISPEQYKLPTRNPAWNVGDTLFHMSLAVRFMPADIRLIRRQKGFPRPPAIVFNKINEWYTKYGGRKATPDYLAAQYDAAHADLMTALDTIGAEEWALGAEYPGWDPQLSGFVTIERLFHYVADHFAAHAAEILRAIQNQE